MKVNLFAHFVRVTFFLAVLYLLSNTSFAQTSAFAYQGRLTENNANASGTYQMQFALYNAATGGSQIGSTIENTAVQVNNGIFTVQLDFGGGNAANVFSGANLFLQISVRKNPTDSYVPLNGRQTITATPYAVRASVAANAEQLNGQAAANYATSSQIAALQNQITTQQTQISAQQTVIDGLRAQLSAATGGAQIWSKRVGGSNYEFPVGIATDSAGDVYVAGYFQGTSNFGGSSFTSIGSYDIFVAKYSGTTGAHIWSKQFGTAADEQPVAIKTDANGNVFIAGYFGGTINFGGLALTSAGSNDIFVVKLSGTDGSHVWSKRFGGSNYDSPNDLFVDGSGDVALTGFFAGSADFGGLILTGAGSYDIFVAKYSGSNGSHLWSKRFGGSGDDRGVGITTDNANNVYITGNFASSSVDFGGGALTNVGPSNTTSDAFLAKFASTTGNHLWSKRFGGTSNESGTKTATDANGNVFFTGATTSSAIDFGGGSISNTGNNVFTAKFNSNGNQQWSKLSVGTAYQRGGIQIDGEGNAIIAGSFSYTTSFGGASLNSSGTSSENIFLVKYSGNDGANIWSKRFGGISGDDALGVAMDSNGNIFITGFFYSTEIDFGGGPLTNLGNSDVFVAKLMK